MYFDFTYVYLVLPALIFALIASANVKSTFKKYSKVQSTTGMTGAQAAQRILSANGLAHIRIEQTSGRLSDHYDPKAGVIRLSPAVYDGCSTAAIGVAAHEVGHALQYAGGYGPIKLRAAIIPVTNLGSKLALPLVFLGLILESLVPFFINFAYAGIVLFGICVVFQFITLPVEFNASRRAMQTIGQYGLLSQNEQAGARRVLSAAALTYVAALAVSLAQLLRFLMMVSRRR